MVTSCWRKIIIKKRKKIKARNKRKKKEKDKEKKKKKKVGFYGYSPLGGEGGLLGYFPLNERVGCRVGKVGFMVTSRWGSWFLGYSLLGERVGCMFTPHWGRG